MKILLLSDTHGKHHELQKLPQADMIIHAGDITWGGKVEEVTDFVEWFGLLVVEIFKSAWLVLTDLFIWLFVSLFSLVADLLQDIGQLFNINGLTSQVSSLWSSIPPETSAILSAIGLPSAMAIIATGILIRFALQLIPFVRLGS